MIEAPASDLHQIESAHCEECGYSLRGLPRGQPCPECGRPTTGDGGSHPRVTWSRSVLIGLLLLIFVTARGVASVLIQPFTDRIDGTLSAVNLPGPKLWAAPLLLRPIGRAPEEPGVAATQCAILSLLAIWLISAPHPHRRDEVVRLALRWMSVALFGAAYGAMLSSQGLWGGELPALRMLLVAGVELPAGTLLYVYFSRLAAHVPGRARRDTLNRLAWLAPLTIALGAALTALRWLEMGAPPAASPLPQTVAFGLNMVYGALAVAAGATATIAVASLAMAYVRPAFATGGRWLGGALGLRAAFRRWIVLERLGGGGRDLAVAAGAVGLLFCMIVGNRWSLQFNPRETPSGLLFYNFSGPKIWASLALERFTTYGWRSNAVSLTTLLTLNLLAVWLLTVRPPPNGVMSIWSERLRRATRWGAVASVGLAGGAMAVLTDSDVWDQVSRHPVRVYAAAMTLWELPATLLLYLHFAAVARSWNRRELAKGFVGTALVAGWLIVMATALFSGFQRPHRAGFTTAGLTLFAAYGAVSVLSATCAAAAVATLAWTAARRALSDVMERASPRLDAPAPPDGTPSPHLG